MGDYKRQLGVKYIKVVHLKASEVPEFFEIWMECSLPMDIVLKVQRVNKLRKMSLEIEAMSRDDLYAIESAVERLLHKVCKSAIT